MFAKISYLFFWYFFCSMVATIATYQEIQWSLICRISFCAQQYTTSTPTIHCSWKITTSTDLYLYISTIEYCKKVQGGQKLDRVLESFLFPKKNFGNVILLLCSSGLGLNKEILSVYCQLDMKGMFLVLQQVIADSYTVFHSENYN